MGRGDAGTQCHVVASRYLDPRPNQKLAATLSVHKNYLRQNILEGKQIATTKVAIFCQSTTTWISTAMNEGKMPPFEI